uniref:Uncharacterized protein LOC100371753 n=1 Tax=Saccoglossus kowalevskii TaxID=10224 RepID=A0ABM0LVG2_SACKO|nr:PREDICTED: uncharacterized protein LOC100371753 [Saccoglossus kowalevskii]
MRIVEISTNAEHLSAAFYFGPSADGSKPGVFNVNCHNFQARPMFEMMSLCLHEAEPGHHLQSSYSVLMDYLPGFRRFKDDRFYGIVPSRFPMHTGYIEGWGMYSEFLGEEMGLYDDPYTLFGRYCSEIFRACRLVVDTGLHVYGWSFEKAVQFIEENTAMSREVIEIEVRRYLTLPGQGCAYTIGELKIRELRKKCEDEFGDKFDLREFHDAVLSCGPVPLTVLEVLINKYINKTLEIPDRK